MNELLIVLPPEVNELAKQVSDNKQTEVQNVLHQIFIGTDDWEKQVNAIEVKDINDKMSIELAEVARKNSKQARLNAEKIFDAKREEVKNLKAEFDLEDKLWLKAKQVMQLKFKAIEEKAAWKANYVKRFEAEQKETRTQKRINAVMQYAEINRIEFEEMSDESFNSFLMGLKSTYEKRIEAEKKAENERIAKEKAEAAERERIRKENEQLRKEAAERERIAKIEAEKRAKEERERQVKAEAERKEREEKERKERQSFEAKLKAEREEKERMQRELEAKAEAERKAKEAEEKRKEDELNKGDAAKVKDLINDLNSLKTKYVFKSVKNNKMYSDVQNLIDKIVNHINN